ncbi:MAG: DUF2007 domain-containing protein [Bacteroidales bacterium]|uniref:putative signal transducing protein n=1 Tax=Porphyromonas sp. TaxID=1924944 RepID=UPI002975DEE1|nr:DUF2007 domain-containing protein [Porphyromonas sp.]MDD7437724.1 DUF2007 domain-containing protein [Bacteroidales bacterium]MDY3067607.1 DUF2007 domain-containing protein [Porphyromonas sp.]
MEKFWNRGGLVEILNSNDANYIHVAHSLLSDKGFFVRVENENTNVIPGLSLGVSLMVREEELNEALKTLEEAGIIPSQSDSPEVIEKKLDDERKTDRRKIWRLLFILLLALGLLALWSIVLNM